MKTIICSHGFAVRADSMGMFTDIAAAFSDDYVFNMFDYYDIKPNGDQIVRSLDEQAAILQQQIDDVPDGEIVLLCHSQGSTVAGLIDPKRISKVILLAPPVEFDSDALLGRLQMRKGSVLNRHGMSIIPRSDGTTMYLPAAYLDSIEEYDRSVLYQKLADTVPTVIIRATQDEILGLTKVDEIKNATHIDIAADHNFTDRSRLELIRVLRGIL